MARAAQMFDHELNGLKGFYPGREWVVDKELPIENADSGAATVNETHYTAGKVVHVDATSGKFRLGLPKLTSRIAGALPFLLFGNGSDFDVFADDNNFTGATAVTTGYSFAQGGTAKALACTFAAEVQSTEFVGSATYAPGDWLTANGTVGTADDNDAAIALGQLRKLAATDVDGEDEGIIVCGVVTSLTAEGVSDHGIATLTFHTAYFPVFSNVVS